MKLCIDCQHYKPGHARDADACMAPTIQKAPDLVRGEPRIQYCEMAREDDLRCGSGAKLFAAKLERVA